MFFSINPWIPLWGFTRISISPQRGPLDGLDVILRTDRGKLPHRDGNVVKISHKSGWNVGSTDINHIVTQLLYNHVFNNTRTYTQITSIYV